MQATFVILGVLLALFGNTAQAAEPAPYSPVTAARLTHPEPGNWLMYRRTYDSWGYSPLKQIDAGNVAQLKPLWSYSTGVEEAHQSPPLVNDGVMFITTPRNQVLALDARSGNLIWRYRRELPADLFQLHPTNRGVACMAIASTWRPSMPSWLRSMHAPVP